MESEFVHGFALRVLRRSGLRAYGSRLVWRGRGTGFRNVGGEVSLSGTMRGC